MEDRMGVMEDSSSVHLGRSAIAATKKQNVKRTVSSPQKKTRKLISFFSGGGGLDLGLEAAGFETVFATDIDYHSCQTLQQGKDYCAGAKLPFLQSATIRQADVIHLTSKDVMQAAGIKKGEVDLMAGGPPCQAFSVFGKRLGVNDPRGLLPYEYLRLLREIEPKAFVFENVFGLLTIHGGETFKELCANLESPGDGITYTLSVFRLNAAEYGVPQFRDRIFIIGSRNGKKIECIPKICGATPEKAYHADRNLLPYRTVNDGLRGIPPLGTKLANHTSRLHSQRIIDRYKNLKHGERDSKTRINKLHPERPSYTIIVGSDKGGGKGHVHPVEPREVSPRESARMQTFPDWWAFSGTSRHPIRQVGNAVPPLLAAVVGREIMQKFFGGERRSFQQLVSILGQDNLFTDDIDGL
ncbi:DNA cytosine methyltransferase [Undibacterium sp. Rencai35W]|uniref:DNA cytosine methyltransferase n=1 Tax=Undibacterium sp. Rencai35W TaxID=3413046 RepID=UPI003BEFF4D1